MTTLYKPVLIESAEQAEALPIGTLAKRPQHYSIEKVDECPDEWTDTCNAEPRTSSDVVGWTALVPIEAEEVIGAELRHQITDKSYEVHVMRSTDMDNARWQVEHNPKSATGRIMRQYRTPWEEA